MFFHRCHPPPAHFIPHSIFSRTRSNLFIAYYIPRNGCQQRGTAEKYRFSFDTPFTAPPPPPNDIHRFISVYSGFIENGFAGVSFFRGRLRRMNSPRYFQTSFRAHECTTTTTTTTTTHTELTWSRERDRERKHLTVDRTGLMDRTILPVGLYDPRR